MLRSLCFFYNFIFSSSNKAFFISHVVKFKYQPNCVEENIECSKCWICVPQLKSGIWVFVIFVVVSGKVYIRKIHVGIFMNIVSYHMKIHSTVYDDLSVTIITSKDSSTCFLFGKCVYVYYIMCYYLAFCCRTASSREHQKTRHFLQILAWVCATQGCSSNVLILWWFLESVKIFMSSISFKFSWTSSHL
jgi:hypothetical protein